MMRATTCEKTVTAKIVVLLDEQQLSLKTDDVVLTKMFGDVISIDDNTMAQKLLFFLRTLLSHTICFQYYFLRSLLSHMALTLLFHILYLRRCLQM